MGDNVFVKAYCEKVEAEQREKKQALEDLVAKGEALFEKNCRVWLGEMWAELEEICFHVLKDSQSSVIMWGMFFKWCGLDGAIRSGRYSTESIWNWDSEKEVSQLTLSIKDMGGPFPIRLALPVLRSSSYRTAYTEEACRVNPIVTGKFLVDALERKQRAIAQQEAQRKAQAEAEFSRQQYELWVEQETQLENDLVEERWRRFTPFKLYVVEYGAKMADDDGRGWTQTCYTLDGEPDAAGWWQEILCGEVHRVRLPHVLRVMEICIATPNDVPINTVEWKSVASEQHPGQTVYLPELPR